MNKIFIIQPDILLDEVCHQDHLDLQQQLANVSACNKLRKYQDIPLEFRKEIRLVSALCTLCSLVHSINLNKEKPGAEMFYTKFNCDIYGLIKLMLCIFRALFKEENAASKGLLRRKKEKLKEIEEKVASLKK